MTSSPKTWSPVSCRDASQPSIAAHSTSGRKPARSAPGYPGGFSAPALAFAVAGTLAWIALVRWRTGRHRPVLWRSLVLPASGLTLVWLLLLTLTLPVLDYARSYRPLVERIARHVPREACITAYQLPTAQIAALEVHGGWRVEQATPERSGCDFMISLAQVRMTSRYGASAALF